MRRAVSDSQVAPGLFSDVPVNAAGNEPLTLQPLAARMRPRSLAEFVGQEHILGEGKLLRRAILDDELSSAIFHGPAGCGKSTLAFVVAQTTKSHFENFSAVTSVVADVRRVMEGARQRWPARRQKTILFVDEIHRFNRAQQDAFLPHVEAGTVVLIGATTENPFFSVNAPLLSRSRLFRFEPLTSEHIQAVLQRALADHARGLGSLHVVVDDGALGHIGTMSNGDARAALNGLELAATSTAPNEEGFRLVTLPIAEDAMQRRAILYDREGDQHYDIVSAFIKSIRGSDPDAALYWMTKMIEAGEDPRYIARRIVVHAAEDIGLADPTALLVATAAAHAVEFVGLPEARIPLAEAVIHLASAPKSNSVVVALERVENDVRTRKPVAVPTHLRDASYQGAARLGHGAGYLYPHNFPGHVVAQEYLPAGAKSCEYYQPGDSGNERNIRERLTAWRRAQEGGTAMSFRMETIEHESGVSVMNLYGELDMNNAKLVREDFVALGERDRPRVAVNLAEVSFIDSTGLGVLVGGLKRMREKGGNLVVFGASERNRKLLEMTGLTSVFALVATCDEALTRLLEGGE